jgi:hypothetical protein
MDTAIAAAATASGSAADVSAQAPPALARYTGGLIGTLAFNSAALLVGVGLIGFAWSALWVFLLPAIVASTAAGVTLFVLNRIAVEADAPAIANSMPGNADVISNR